MKKIVFVLLILVCVLVACSQTTIEKVDSETEISKDIKIKELESLIEQLEEEKLKVNNELNNEKESSRILFEENTKLEESIKSNDEFGDNQYARNELWRVPFPKLKIQDVEFDGYPYGNVVIDNILYLYDEFGYELDYGIDSNHLKVFENIKDTPKFTDISGIEHEVKETYMYDGVTYFKNSKKDIYKPDGNSYSLILSHDFLNDFRINEIGVGYNLETDLNSLFFEKFDGDEVIEINNIDSPRGLGLTRDYIWGIDENYVLKVYNLSNTDEVRSFELINIAKDYWFNLGYTYEDSYKGFVIMDSNNEYVLIGDMYTQILIDQDSMTIATVCYGDYSTLTDDGKLYYASNQLLVSRDIDTQKDHVICSNLNPWNIIVIEEDVFFWVPFDGPAPLVHVNTNVDFFKELNDKDVDVTFLMERHDYGSALQVYDHKLEKLITIVDSVFLQLEVTDSGYRYTTDLYVHGSDSYDWVYCHVPEDLDVIYWSQFKGEYSKIN